MLEDDNPPATSAAPMEDGSDPVGDLLDQSQALLDYIRPYPPGPPSVDQALAAARANDQASAGATTTPWAAAQQYSTTSGEGGLGDGVFRPENSEGAVTPVINPIPSPYRLTGSWSAPIMAASPGQSGTARQGAQAIEDAYATGKGQPYIVDPQTMGMEAGIDLHKQIQDSVNQGGYMAGILRQAIATGKPVDFDGGNWRSPNADPDDTGWRRFKHPPELPDSWDGRSVGRWGGAVQGTMTADGNGHWVVTGTIVPAKLGTYDFTQDAGGTGLGKAATNAEITALGTVRNVDNGFKANKVGTPMHLMFNRYYNYKATGLYPLK